MKKPNKKKVVAKQKRTENKVAKARKKQDRCLSHDGLVPPPPAPFLPVQEQPGIFVMLWRWVRGWFR